MQTTTQLPTTQLGQTGLEITRVGFGAWAIGGGGWEHGWGPQDDAESIAAIHRAGEQLVVIARWTDEAAIRRWVDDPERVRTNAVLAPHLADEPARRGYTVAVEWPPTPTGGDQP